MPDELDITTVSPLLIVLNVCAVCVECLTFGDFLVLFGVDEADDELRIDGSTPTVGNTKQYFNDSKVYLNL